MISQPDGVQRGLVGDIISRFEKRGYKVRPRNELNQTSRPVADCLLRDLCAPPQLVGLKMATPGKDHLEKHYADLSSKAFFPGLISYMNSGPVVGMVWEGRDAVK
jgi:nucleoside-diphosphate kinase